MEFFYMFVKKLELWKRIIEKMKTKFMKRHKNG